MGPTAAGKTDLAIALAQHLPVDVISVDSAMVYKGMNIGSAKPSPEELAKVPHRLIDICDPAKPYSVADFCDNAEVEIQRSVANSRIPLLVGGTMMYFKALLDGLADMPASDASVRAAIAEEAERLGWPALHEQLMAVDPEYARQLHPNHSQRISRALEVYRLSGKTMGSLREAQRLNQVDDAVLLTNRFDVIQLALLPSERSVLHARIEKRFLQMLEQGFVDEVKQLHHRGDLHLDLPSMRAVGYRQVWHYLDALEKANEDYSYETMVHRGLVATRQLAKRQLTWLRAWPDLHRLPIDESMNGSTLQKNVEFILNFLSTRSI